MDLNIFQNLKKEIESNVNIKNFVAELSDFINNITAPKTQNNINNKVQNHRKEGHLYLVTEDRNNEVYLWDFTDKPKYEFVEKNFSKELLNVATEGTMLQYKNGKYELYSPNGYDMLDNEKNN